MKRTELKRKTPLKARTQMKRGGPVRARKGQARRSRAWRSPQYLAWVRTLPCCVCGAQGGNEAHHIKGVGHYSGAGMKAGDDLSMALCAEHHRELHATPERWPLQHGWVALTQLQAKAAGWELP